MKSFTTSEKHRKIIMCLKRDKLLYLMLLPAIIIFVIFKYLPMGGLVISFKKYYPLRGFANSPWVGFRNFTEFFSSMDFYIILRNTILLNIYSILFGFPMPIIFALMLNEIQSIKFKKTVQTISYLPHFISTVVIVGMITAFLSPSTGPLNQFISLLGLKPINFLGDSRYFRSVYVISGIWQGIGWGSIIYLAAISGIDVSLYEAAIVDGAGKLKQIWFITIPCISSTIVIMLILRMGSILSVGFEKTFLLSNPLVNDVSRVISIYVYEKGILGANYSFATAVGLFESVVGLVFIGTANYISKKVTEVGIW